MRANPKNKRLVRLALEPLEPRQLLAADLVISEFLASNDNDVRDADYSRPDWIEILNTSSAQVSLGGWYLTDDAQDLTKWRFGDVRLGAGERIVVFASGKDRRQAGAELHTNFRLDAAGGYLALVQPDGVTVAFDYGPQYLPQLPDVSFGIPQAIGEIPLAVPGSAVRALVPLTSNGGNMLGQSWTAVDFDDSTWITGTTGVGYERSTGYEELIGTDVAAQMYELSASVYLRVPFVVEDPSAIFSLSLSVQYDDGYVALVNGMEVARRNAPDELTWDARATARRRDNESLKFEEVDLSEFVNFLRAGRNVLAIQGLNDDPRSNDFLIVPKLTAVGATELLVHSRNYFTHPTAGTPNGLGTTTAIVNVSHAPLVPHDNDDVTVSAALSSISGDVAAMTLHYRVMFDQEVSVAMRDDGLHGDGAAGDRLFGATIPASVASPGQMIRYRITAGDSPETSTSAPVFADPRDRQQYLGTVVADPSVELASNLPVMHLFVENFEASTTLAGTQGAFFYDGEFYDNVHIDVHGFTTKGFPKKSHDIYFPRDHRFRLADDLPRYKDINILTNYGDPVKVRNTLAYGTYRQTGTPAHLAFPIRVQRNGQFLGIYDFVEDGDDEFLEREGLDPRGALYKMDSILDSSVLNLEKKTRTEEDHSDLQALIDGVTQGGEARTTYVLDNVNIPAMVNYIAGLVLTGETDCCHRNYYAYRDTEGTGLWQYMPWDVDKTFGRLGTFDEGVQVDFEGLAADAERLKKGRGNNLITALFEIPEVTPMFLRRLRTLLDQIVQPPGTPEDERYLEQRVDQLVEQLAADMPQDLTAWGSLGSARSWEENVRLFKSDYLPARRQLLYDALTRANGGQELHPQVGAPAIQFGAFDYNPASGNQDEEYIELGNPNQVAVDISGWRLAGGVRHTFHPGTVIPAGGKLYVSPNVRAFRARQTGPSGAQGLFVQGNYAGHLSNFGETIQLVASDGTVVATLSTPFAPSEAQQYLRVSEIMYHPRNPDGGSPWDDEAFEFVELVNISNTVTLALERVAFTDAVQFVFPEMSLGPGQRVVVVGNREAFESRYGTQMAIAGQYQGRLSNGGERMQLDDASGSTIEEVLYDDQPPWPSDADGLGSSLVRRDVFGRGSAAASWTAEPPSPGSTQQFVPQAGDSNLDRQFDQRDIVLVLQGGKYLTGQAASFSDGDWNRDGLFDQRDIVAALQTGTYLRGP